MTNKYEVTFLETSVVTRLIEVEASSKASAIEQVQEDLALRSRAEILEETRETLDHHWIGV